MSHQVSQPADARYQNIDVLRGIAALLVVWLHASHLFVQVPSISAHGTLAADVPAFLHLGRAGVVAFFAISGFVVASTIREPKGLGTWQFAIKRFFRLYPAYWLTVLFTYLAIWVPLGRQVEPTALLANLTMLPTLFGVESAMGHFWTLEIEFMFYVLVVVLFLVGKLRDTRMIVALIFMLSIIPGVQFRELVTWTTGQAHWADIPLCLAIMLWGSLLRHSYDPNATSAEKLRAWMTWPVIVTTLLVFGRVAYGGLRKLPDLVAFFAERGTLWGLILFVVFLFLGSRWPRPLVWLGTISYSIYLLHPVVMYPLFFLVSRTPDPSFPASLFVYSVLATAITVAFASASYLLVERPSNRLARRLTEKGTKSGTGADPSVRPV
jgi:peptidoglycan/LPS O-acetylase OafA/YrhL